MHPIAIIAVIAFIVIIFVIAAFAQTAKRKQELQAWASETGLRFDPEKSRDFEERYPLHKCLASGSNRYAHNVMEGRRSDRRVCAFDYHYETYSTDSKGNRQTNHHHFSVVVVDSGLPLKNLTLRPEGFFDKVTEFFGHDDIDFESGEFSRKFYVKAPDRRWAFDVFHQATMEFMLEMPRFTLEMAGPWIMVRRSRRFKPKDFSDALAVAEGILDRLPEFLLRELTEEGEDA